jgi:hypothetical protein
MFSPVTLILAANTVPDQGQSFIVLPDVTVERKKSVGKNISIVLRSTNI